jgi:hypothetical protein
VSVAPDYAEAFHGWRLWWVGRVTGELRLRSLVRGGVWPPGAAMVATCPLSSARPLLARLAMRPHEAPVQHCSCGVHALRRPERLRSLLRADWPCREEPGRIVVGRVALWGRMVVADHGWRASHAYPAEIFVPAEPAVAPDAHGDASELGSVYRVPSSAILVDTQDDLVDALAAVAAEPR